AASQAQKIASAQKVDALVWVTGAGSDAGLWVFDLDTQQLIARRIERVQPLDAATAAALALSVKTLLRASTVAPPPERIGAAALSRPREQLRLEALVGAQAQLGVPKSVELRLGAAVAYYPRALRERFGVALQVLAGPGVSIDRATFSGRFTE